MVREVIVCARRRDLAIECMSMFFIENLASMDTHTHTDACCHSCLSTLDRRSAASTCTDKLFSIKQQSNGTRGKRQGQRAQHGVLRRDLLLSFCWVTERSCTYMARQPTKISLAGYTRHYCSLLAYFR